MGEQGFTLEQRSVCSFASHIASELGAVVYEDVALELHLANLVANDDIGLSKPLLGAISSIKLLSGNGAKLSSVPEFIDIFETDKGLVEVKALIVSTLGFNSEGTLRYTFESEDESQKTGMMKIHLSTNIQNGRLSPYYYGECIDHPATLRLPGLSEDVEIPVVRLDRVLVSELFTFESSGNSARISELATILRGSQGNGIFNRRAFEKTMGNELASASGDTGKISSKYTQFLAFLDGKQAKFSTMPPARGPLRKVR